MAATPSPLPMLRVALSDARTGDGFRTAFVLAQRRQRAVLYVPSLLTSVTVPAGSLETAQAVRYRPKVVRGHMLARARLYRRHGHRFAQQATVEVLRRLGAAGAVIEETVSTAPLPEVVAARERKATQAERAIETAAAVQAIGERITLRQEEERMRAAAKPASASAPRPRRTRQRCAHPDQLALGL